MDYKTILECQALLEDGKVIFPDILERLLKAGVESCVMDLSVKRAFYYDEFDQSLDLPLWVEEVAPETSPCDAETFKDFVRLMCRGGINHPALNRELTRIGIARYIIDPRQSTMVGFDKSEKIFPEVFLSKS